MSKVNTFELVGKLLERGEATHEKIQAYHGLLAYWALGQAAVYQNDEQYLQKCKTYLSLYPDHFDHPLYNHC